MLEAKRLAEEERRSQAQIFEPAVVKSKMLWPTVQPLIHSATEEIFNAIAKLVKSSFICASSFPAHMVAKVCGESGDFYDCELNRFECTYARIQNL